MNHHDQGCDVIVSGRFGPWIGVLVQAFEIEPFCTVLPKMGAGWSQKPVRVPKAIVELVVLERGPLRLVEGGAR